jgi:hypothetical protein
VRYPPTVSEFGLINFQLDKLTKLPHSLVSLPRLDREDWPPSLHIQRSAAKRPGLGFPSRDHFGRRLGSSAETGYIKPNSATGLERGSLWLLSAAFKLTGGCLCYRHFA